MMLTFQRILLTALLSIILMPLMAQDITGDWYGRYQSPDSMHINLHISKDKNGLKATWDSPDEDVFGIPVPVITFENDELVFEIHARYITYVGQVNHDYSSIKGHMWTGDLMGLDFGRTKLLRMKQVRDSSLTALPARTEAVKAGNPRIITYSGVRVIEASDPEAIEIDTSKLKILIPGNDTVLHPILYKFPDPVTRIEYPFQEGNSRSAPIITTALQTEPVPANPMRMKDAACFNIQYLDIEQGLPDPDIRSIMEDSKGNIWLGTNSSGICSYNGKSFNYYTGKEGLPGLGNRSIIEDRHGTIWIGTNLGVCRYDGKSFIHYSGGAIHSIMTILETENGEIWFGTDKGAIVKKGSFWTKYRKNEGLPDNTVTVVIEDNNGDIWLGTEKGLCKFDGLAFTHYTEKEGLISNVIRSGLKDRYGNLWFGTDKGVCRYDGRTFMQFTARDGLSGNYINTIAEDHNGNLWFGTNGGGVTMYDGNQFSHFTTREGLTSDHITSIIEDDSKNLWLGTADGGVMKLQRNSFNYFIQFENISKGQVTSITEDRNGDIWFGIYGEGLLKYNGRSFQAFTANEGLNDNYIHSVKADKPGNIWFINNHGLQKFDGKTVASYSVTGVTGSTNGNYMECIYEDDTGNIWIGTRNEGLIKYNGDYFIHFSGITPGYITSVLQDSKGNVWYGTSTSGVQKYDGECITRYNINEGLSGLEVTAIFEDDKGDLWIGLNEGGVNKFNDSSIICITEQEGLISKNVRSITGDNEGNIWVGTTAGLSRLYSQADGGYSIISFGTEDGLKDISFNRNAVFLDSRNQLWWGTGNTVTKLDLNKSEITPAAPAIQLTSIYLNQVSRVYL